MRLKTLLPLLYVIALFGSCRKDQLFTDDPGATLSFSEDEVLFDTVFALSPPIGTVTKSFRVHNDNDGAVRVDIALEGGTASPFRINVDGASGTVFEDIEILAGDSIYVFVEATLDQSNQNAPLIHEDHVVFHTNGNEQKVKLIAWGQDAHYFHPDIFPNGLPAYSIIAGGTDPGGNCIPEVVTWTNDKPYVIYGYAAVDSCATLIIEPGVRVYVHGGGGLWIYRWGRIQAEGTPQDPITFQGDRLEELYADLPGQWDRIWINDGPAGGDNIFTNVRIKNALVGIQCETWPGIPDAVTSEARIIIDNVSIRNCSAAGILSRNYRIDATDLLVGDCGQFSVALTGGGEYHFDHMTVANYWNFGVRNDPAFIMTNTYPDINGTLQVREITNSSFTNSIIHGSNSNEFLLDFNDLDIPTASDLSFRGLLVQTDQSTTGDYFPAQDSIWRNQSPGFIDVSERNLHLTVGAFARNKAAAVTSNFDALEDLDGEARFGSPTDLGCYEYVE